MLVIAAAALAGPQPGLPVLLALLAAEAAALAVLRRRA
jgi:hypothetical protein